MMPNLLTNDSLGQALAFGSTTMTPEHFSSVLKIFLSLSLLSIIPALLIMLTSFSRIIVVLSLLRTALGLQQTPPNSILMSLALFLTLFTMMPIIKIAYQEAYIPYLEHRIDEKTAFFRAQKPLRHFMIRQTREKDLQLLFELGKINKPRQMKDIPLYLLAPAFLLSELQTAFQIGFIIFLPFLLVDLVVSGLLMTMGMMMVPPASIALPIKILVFVLIDGWNIVIQSLVNSFHI